VNNRFPINQQATFSMIEKKSQASDVIFFHLSFSAVCRIVFCVVVDMKIEYSYGNHPWFFDNLVSTFAANHPLFPS
jgi:uncharacterized membrane protein YagU involved in acid resistance